MFAVIKNKTVIGFITEEDQKPFLLENDSTVSFAEFVWPNDNTDIDNLIMPSDVAVNDDGTVTVLKEPNP